LSAGDFALETMMLRAMQQPSHIDGLLKSLVKSMSIVPDDADVVEDSSELPPDLQKVISAATKAGQSSCAWTDAGFHVWLFVGEMSLPLSRERGSLVLEVKYHREHGLRETGTWVIDRNAKWHRLVD
jgi:hypothetical protein